MQRKLKALGLALMAAFAVSAVASSSASATATITTVNNDYPAVLTGTEEGETKNNFFESTPGFQIHCPNTRYEARLEQAQTSVTVTPHYGSGDPCEATTPVGNFAAGVNLNGCHFVFEALLNTTETDTHGRAKLVCPQNQQVVVTAGTCRVDIPPQTVGGGAGEITYTNKPGESEVGTPHDFITVDVNVENKIHYTDTDAFLCPFNGDSTNEDGDFKANVRIKGYEDEGNVTDPNTAGQVDYKHPATETDIHVK